jgi:methanogenic corrinoid protein MtbC1
LLFSCEQKDETMNVQKFGGEVTLEESVSLAAIYNNPDQDKDKEIRVEGMIKEVCQHKGCWLKLTDGTNELTVRFKDYGFFVPKEAATSNVIVQGIFTMEPDMHVDMESEKQTESKELGR